ncbi:transposase [Alicyclobacillus fastidiosus]|nr:transposase [Alicyclobacillus fastidiosus]GMA63012.1 hypothetical protein GCM10025859_34520 [Alicyclobacillus fastidiosus]
MYRRWLDGLKWTDRREQVVYQEYLHHLDEIEGRLKPLEAAIHLEATESERTPVIQALQTLKGVAEVIATSLVAEVGEFRRFRNPKQLMAYAGLVPSEYSSGVSRKQGRITKSGNAHLRRVLGEAAWCYRYKPAIKGKIRKRQEGQSPLAMVDTFSGHIELAKHDLHPRWMLMYIPVYLFGIWDSYQPAVDINNVYLLAEREDAPYNSIASRYWIVAEPSTVLCLEDLRLPPCSSVPLDNSKLEIQRHHEKKIRCAPNNT